MLYTLALQLKRLIDPDVCRKCPDCEDGLGVEAVSRTSLIKHQSAPEWGHIDCSTVMVVQLVRTQV